MTALAARRRIRRPRTADARRGAAPVSVEPAEPSLFDAMDAEREPAARGRLAPTRRSSGADGSDAEAGASDGPRVTGTGARAECVPAADGATLDALISETWGALLDGRAVNCPLCDGAMVPGVSAHARPSRARCGDCGTVLD